MNYDKPVFVDHTLDRMTDFDSCSIWKTPAVDVSFSFINFDYPVLHIHKDFCEILFVYSGEVVNYVNDESVIMKAGDCCFIRKSDGHKIAFTTDTGRNLIAVNFIMRDRYFDRVKYAFGESQSVLLEEDNGMKLFHLDNVTSASIFNQLLLMQTPDNVYVEKNEFSCKKIILELISEYVGQKLNYTSSKTVPAWLSDMLFKMQDRANIDKSPNDFIKEVPYSYSYVAREFKKYMGFSAMKYLTSIKLNYAKELLQNTDLTTMEISLAIGLESLSHFNHVFKDHFGETPSEVRKKKN